MYSKAETARGAALEVLNKIFDEQAYANIALDKYLRRSRLSPQDRRLATELVYGTVKRKGTIDWILSRHLSRPLGQVTPVIRNILREGVYQLYFLERIPPSAAVNEAVNLAKVYGHAGTVKFVNGVLRNVLRKKEEVQFPALEDDAVGHISLAYSHPAWLVEKWLAEFGQENTLALCAYDNENRSLSFRVNTLCISREELLDKLAGAGCLVHPSQWSRDGIVADKLPGLGEFMRQFGQYIYFQDEASMLVADICAPQEGELVLDACAAPGGKTTHLAQRMGNKGSIVAADIHEHKVKLIAENAQRLGITNITTCLADATQFRKDWEKKFDLVLADVPCSGLGVLGKRAEARWRKTAEGLAELPPLQKKILDNVAQYVKPGGRLVYSTCTLNRAENGDVISAFLANHPDFQCQAIAHPITGERLGELQTLPFADGIDGFYFCLLGRSK